MLWWWTAAALAQETVATVTVELDAAPDEVHALISDLGRWPEVWSLEHADGPDPRQAWGFPGTLDQNLRWSASERARGGMVLTDLDDDGLSYQVRWTEVPTVAIASRLPTHTGHMSLEAADGGTELTWTVEGERMSGEAASRRARRRLEDMVDAAAARLIEALEGPPPDPPVAPGDGVLAWQGMHHRWTYNHRVNRLGSWWTSPDCDDGRCTTIQMHAAASGSGPDRASFDGLGAWLTGPGVQGWYGSIGLWIDGREGRQLSSYACVELPPGVPDGPVLLRGFDLDAAESADSLWSARLAVEREGRQVCGLAELKMACRTPECGTERLTTYLVELPFVVVTAPDLRVTAGTATQGYEWRARDLRDEPDPSMYPLSATLDVDPERPALVGVTGLTIDLDEPHHTLGLDLAVRPGAPEGDELPVELDLFYIQWGPVEIAPMTPAQFSRPGSAEIGMDLLLVQPAAGVVSPLRGEGRLFWPGKGADGTSTGAEHRVEVALP